MNAIWFICFSYVFQVHAYIISSLRKEMPSVFGKDVKKKELIKNLETTYENLQREYKISPGDFPDVKRMQQILVHCDFTKFNILKPRLLEVVDKMLVEDISKLMEMLPLEETAPTAPEPLIKGEKLYDKNYLLLTCPNFCAII